MPQFPSVPHGPLIVALHAPLPPPAPVQTYVPPVITLQFELIVPVYVQSSVAPVSGVRCAVTWLPLTDIASDAVLTVPLQSEPL
jgi:hypothetical protein